MFKIKPTTPFPPRGWSASRAINTRSALPSTRPMRCCCAATSCTANRCRSSLLAVARAGAGVNNVPVAEYGQQGIVVFNTPGANANAVKELVLAGMLLATRGILPGIAYAQSLGHMSDSAAMHALLEKESPSSPAANCAARRWASSAWAPSARWWPTSPCRWA